MPPEQAEISAGSTPASSKACRTPMSDTHAPAPPPAISATRCPSKPLDRAGPERRQHVGVDPFGRSTSGSGNSARRARNRNAGSSVARDELPRSRTQPNPRSTL